MKTIYLTHDKSVTLAPPPGRDNIRLVDLNGKLQDQASNSDAPPPSPTSPKSYLIAQADLSLYPGETKIIELSTIPREVGDAKALAAEFGIDNDDYKLGLRFELEIEDQGWTDELGIGRSLGSGSRKRARGEITSSGGNAAWWMRDKTGKLWKKPIRAADPIGLKYLSRDCNGPSLI